MTITCDYCGRPAQFIDSAVVYGRSYGMIYYCAPCRAWVGVHKGTTKPLGRLANHELREWKKAAHAAFDPLWQGGRMKRNAAYAWLARQMNLPEKLTHIGMFDVSQCKQVVSVCTIERSKNHGKQQSHPRPATAAG